MSCSRVTVASAALRTEELAEERGCVCLLQACFLAWSCMCYLEFLVPKYLLSHCGYNIYWGSRVSLQPGQSYTIIKGRYLRGSSFTEDLLIGYPTSSPPLQVISSPRPYLCGCRFWFWFFNLVDCLICLKYASLKRKIMLKLKDETVLGVAEAATIDAKEAPRCLFRKWTVPCHSFLPNSAKAD